MFIRFQINYSCMIYQSKSQYTSQSILNETGIFFDIYIPLLLLFLASLRFDLYAALSMIRQFEMSDCESQSNTELYSNSSLNNARINSPSEVFSTPSTRPFRNKQNKKHIQWHCGSDEEDDDEEWRLLLTKSIEEAASKTPLKSELTASLHKNLEKTAEITNKQGCRFQTMCPICLSRYNSIRGSLACQHQFCFDCIQQWCKTSTACPCCRGTFNSILKLVGGEGGAIMKTERVEVEAKEFVLNSEYDYYTCYQCGLGDNEHVLLICDGCDFYCCHVYCDPVLRHQVPDGDWFCIYCRENPLHQANEAQSEEESPEKVVAQRTRSRESARNIRSHLSTLRSMRRRR